MATRRGWKYLRIQALIAHKQPGCASIMVFLTISPLLTSSMSNEDGQIDDSKVCSPWLSTLSIDQHEWPEYDHGLTNGGQQSQAISNRSHIKAFSPTSTWTVLAAVNICTKRMMSIPPPTQPLRWAYTRFSLHLTHPRTSYLVVSVDLWGLATAVIWMFNVCQRQLWV